MKDSQNNQVEPKVVEPKEEQFEAVELFIECDSVNVSKSRYKALIKSEVTLELVEKLYRITPSYKMDELLALLFGPKDDSDVK